MPAHQRPVRLATEPHVMSLRIALLMAFALVQVGCDFLPQNGTEWGVALGIVVVLVGLSVFLAIKGARQSKR